jgi:hypothetical protein
MSDDYFLQEARIQEALAQIPINSTPKFTYLANLHNVLRKHLCARWNGWPSRRERKPTNQCLNEVQIKALELYVQRLDALGQSPLIPQLRAAAESIQRQTTPMPERLLLTPHGRDFFTRFVRNNPRFSKVRQKPQETACVFSQEREVYGKHFAVLSKIICSKGILPEDIWNIDECSFRIGIGGAQDVITVETHKAAESPSKTNRDFITIVEAISAAGDTIPPHISQSL